jgi:hypothetical protein
MIARRSDEYGLAGWPNAAAEAAPPIRTVCGASGVVGNPGAPERSDPSIVAPKNSSTFS